MPSLALNGFEMYFEGHRPIFGALAEPFRATALAHFRTQQSQP